MDRREFCLTGALAATGFAVAGSATVRLPLAMQTVVFDARFPVARTYGAAARRKGQTLLAIRGDVTALWRDELLPRWRAGAANTLGMTTEPSFFCLQQLAKDHWLRVLEYRAVQDDQRLVSWVIGGADA